MVKRRMTKEDQIRALEDLHNFLSWQSDATLARILRMIASVLDLRK